MERAVEIENQPVVISSPQLVFQRAQKTIRCSVRVSPNGYLFVLFLASFVAGLLVFLDREISGLVLIITAWLIIPVLAFTDRIIFDNTKLIRTGLLSFFLKFLHGKPLHIPLSQIELIETEALRTLRSGGKVFYRYRTEICGNGLTFVFASGGKNYRQMIRTLFSLVNEAKLDLRSLELRDYLVEPAEIEAKLRKLELPSAEILDDSPAIVFRARKKREKVHLISALDTVDTSIKRERAALLRQTGNELRVAGNLRQAVEAFRRALLLNPSDGWLLYDFARCWFSFSGASKTERGARRAMAALRLAVKRGKDDQELLARIGESFFQFGNFDRAEKIWKTIVSTEHSNFRAERGLAEIALQNGKIAHAIHRYAAAAFAAAVADETLKNWAQTEADYFARLNDDDEYLQAEMSRLGWLQNVYSSKKIVFRLALAGITVIFCGLLFDDLIAVIGWIFTSVALLVWLGLIGTMKILAPRSPLSEKPANDF